ncbi:MAG TPA: 2-dehydropantoate 2-reductase N-terminal domain-containing protein [Bacteroidales bacterium]|nr:2-dehydropantoate 2-reductase N-terminal domain-containing protein [Bacteroidales bacterium]
MTAYQQLVVIAGAGAIGTALGQVLAEAGAHVLLHTVEEDVAQNINLNHSNSKYFPAIRLHPELKATTSTEEIKEASIVFLAVPSTAVVSYVSSLQPFLNDNAILVNMAKGFSPERRTIAEELIELVSQKVATLKGPSFARELINYVPTAFTIGSADSSVKDQLYELFEGTCIYTDFTKDVRGVELLSILKNIYAIAAGIVDAHFDSPNLRFLVLTRAFYEMRAVMLHFGGKKTTMFRYCGYGDFGLTALNDLSRNRTLGLLIGKGFFTDNISQKVVLEGKIAANIFCEELMTHRDLENFPILHELYKVFNVPNYDVRGFVDKILQNSR